MKTAVFVLVLWVGMMTGVNAVEWPDLPFSGIIVSMKDGESIYEPYEYSDVVLKRSSIDGAFLLVLVSRGTTRKALQLDEAQEQRLAKAYRAHDARLREICVDFTVDQGDPAGIQLHKLDGALLNEIEAVLTEDQTLRMQQFVAREYGSRVEPSELIKSELWARMQLGLNEDESTQLEEDVAAIEAKLNAAIRKAREEALQELIDAVPDAKREAIDKVFGPTPEK